MAKTAKRKIGDVGEEIVSKYLLNKGYSVAERNYWRPWGEIDIVAEREGRLHFVEVKSVSRESGKEYTVRPEENMHEGKLRRLHRAVQTYLLEKKVPESREWQIDLACVAIDFESRKAQVRLMENIVL